MRLPVGAEMTLAGVYREREIRIVMIGSDPRAVQSDPRGDAARDTI
jgi:hypothetical protein